MEYLTKENITALFAVIGGITGLMTFLWQVVDRQDRIHVEFGSVRLLSPNETAMYVVNLSKHSVLIRDYGFVRKNGDLRSVREFLGDGFPSYQSGSTFLPSREKFEVGIRMRLDVVGAYAVTATQSAPIVKIAKGNWFQRIYVKARAKYVNRSF